MSQKTYKFHASGLHCNACVLMTESELLDLGYIKEAKTSLKDNTVTVTGEFGDKSPEIVADMLTDVLKKNGYSLTVEKKDEKRAWSEFKVAIPVALLFAAAFIFLQKIGLVNMVGNGEVSYGSVFLIGIVASLSSCMAVVGGLLLSMSATFAKSGSKLKPQMMFHVGRIVSFAILGGVIGAIGSAFALSTAVTVALGIIIALVMFVLGLNLLNIFHFTKRLLPSMPKLISQRALNMTKVNSSLTPLLVGIATFFLPCGFTQSMQLYALGTGSFGAGAATMLVFALGTLPVLTLISFSSFSFQKSAKSGIFFKSAGLIVIMFAILNLINSLVIWGLIPPVFSF